MAQRSLGGGVKRPDHWAAMIYEDAESVELADEVVPGFKIAELCRDYAFRKLEDLDAVERRTFACGHRCGPNEEFAGMWSCQTVINAEDF